VILLERIGRLGHMGDVVRVKDGFARNFLLPKGKALRATKENKAKFEGMKGELEATTVILATGSVGRSIPGVELGGRVLGTEQAWALSELPARLAVVGCGVNVTLDPNGLCTDARVVLGAVAPTQLIVDEAADALKGHRLDDDTLSRLDAAAQRACKPINDKRGTIEYRTKVAGVLARRAAAIAFERAAGRVAGVH